MSLDKAYKDPYVGKVIKENTDIFSSEDKKSEGVGWKEELSLLLFALHEWQKGDESIWKPYFDLMPDITFFCDWSEDEIAAC